MLSLEPRKGDNGELGHSSRKETVHCIWSIYCLEGVTAPHRKRNKSVWRVSKGVRRFILASEMSSHKGCEVERASKEYPVILAGASGRLRTEDAVRRFSLDRCFGVWEASTASC
ncbi:hypothetical protein HAX54_053499 [Datura stramonium]|uniref:Uncharacterized protein n=1 Tax=Datura stramonium TaxID=4076 RepID=A0ABS8WS98_DATST|nr:hypothetical protein [Datura stramonium]